MPEKTVQKEPGKKPAPSKKPKPQQEVVVQISLSELHPFPDHPFQVREDASMQETAESVKEYGVLVPALARPREDGGYELIAGHRRKHACELAGLATMPVIVRDIDRDAATIIMVDSNLQRENILPSERAKAYKMKILPTTGLGPTPCSSPPILTHGVLTATAIWPSAAIPVWSICFSVRLAKPTRRSGRKPLSGIS